MTILEAISSIGSIIKNTGKAILSTIGNMDLKSTVNAGVIIGTAAVVCYAAYRYAKARVSYVNEPENMSPVDKALALNNMNYRNDEDLCKHMKDVKKELYGKDKKSASKRRKKRMKARELRDRMNAEFSEIRSTEDYSFRNKGGSKKKKRPIIIDCTTNEPFRDPEYEAMYDYGMKTGGLFRQAIESGRIQAANC